MYLVKSVRIAVSAIPTKLCLVIIFHRRIYNGVVWESWSRRGAFRDWFTLDFPGGWTFRMGTNYLGRVTV